jgi:polyhydroxyalkanoate synthase
MVTPKKKRSESSMATNKRAPGQSNTKKSGKAKKKKRAAASVAGKTTRKKTVAKKTGKQRAASSKRARPSPNEPRISAEQRAQLSPEAFRKDGRASAEHVLGANPIVGLDFGEMSAAVKSMLKLMAVRPDRVIKEELKLVGELGRIAIGRSEVTPDPKDRRFQHEIWRKSGYFKRIMQGYLAWRSSLGNILESASASEREKERARFALALLTEAVAPTNTLLGNPGALMRITQTKGRSLLDGAANLLDDLLHNGGMPKQVDDSEFRVGKNLAASPGAVVFRNEIIEVIQYEPTSAKVHERPLLVVPPQINKFYILDLSPGRSFAEYACQNGVQLFAISWRNPTAANRDWNLETYLSACKQAIAVVRAVTDSPQLNLLAACAGGYTATTLLGHLAALGETPVHTTTLLVTVLDSSSPTLLGLFASRNAISAAIKKSHAKGVLEGSEMARAFSWLRPNDLIWSYVANNWLMGNKPPAFDILYWNADSTRLPAAFHADLLELFLENPLVEPGKLKVLGTPIDLSKVECETFVVAGDTDHITPWKACYETRKLLGGKVRFVLSSSGHVQSIVNPPGKRKARFYTHDDLNLEADDWLLEAQEHEGSWWEYWVDWYRERAGGSMKDAPTELGSPTHPAGDAAPGRYVHQR